MNEPPRFEFARVFSLVPILLVAWTLAQKGVAQAVVFVDTTTVHRGVLGEPGQMHSTLASLDALPSGSDPTVVYVQSIDSRYTINNEIYSSDTSLYRKRVEVISAAAADEGGPTPIFVATQWGTPQSREADRKSVV